MKHEIGDYVRFDTTKTNSGRCRCRHLVIGYANCLIGETYVLLIEDLKKCNRARYLLTENDCKRFNINKNYIGYNMSDTQFELVLAPKEKCKKCEIHLI